MFYIFLTYGFGYGLRPKFFRAEHSATAEGENCAYGPTLLKTNFSYNVTILKSFLGEIWLYHLLQKLRYSVLTSDNKKWPPNNE